MGYRIIERPLGWVVVNADRERISPVLRTREAARDWALRMQESRQPGKRLCLNCKREFRSDGIHDRLCPVCGSAARDAGLVVSRQMFAKAEHAARPMRKVG